MTRREKLVAILTYFDDNGYNLEDVIAHLESFKAAGNSGIENWLNETFAQFGTNEQEEEDGTTVRIRQLVSELSQLV